MFLFRTILLVVLLAAMVSAAADVTPNMSLEYPPLALQARIRGIAKVECQIGSDGAVSLAKGISGHPLFMAPALANARGWRFQPGLAAKVVLIYEFRLGSAGGVSYQAPYTLIIEALSE